MQMFDIEGLSVRPAIVVAVEMEKVKQFWSLSSTLSDVMEIGTHCKGVLAFIWKLLFRAVKLSEPKNESKRGTLTMKILNVATRLWKHRKISI